MTLFQSNYIALFMFFVGCITRINAVDPATQRLRDCKGDMLNAYGRFGLLKCVAYSIQHYVDSDFSAEFMYARSYYYEFGNLNLMYSDEIRLPSEFCGETFEDDEEEIEKCTRNLTSLFGTERDDILNEALYYHKQKPSLNNNRNRSVNTNNHKIHSPGSYAHDYLDDIANHVTVDNTNEVYASPAVYCDYSFNRNFQNIMP